MSAPKVALITGASSGIGRSTSIALAAAGWSIVLSGRREEELEETKKACVGGGVHTIVPGDVSKESNVKVLFEKIEEVYGRLDLVFNNAGISGKSIPLETLDLESFESVMAINVTAPLLCTKYAIKIMKAQTPQGGRIINNGSIAAYSPRPNATSYTMSKHAISGLTKCTSLDGRKYNIACAQIDIGNAATKMGGGAANGVPQADGEIKPEPTFDVEEVARSIVFMAGMGLEANVFNLTIMASAMPFIARG